MRRLICRWRRKNRGIVARMRSERMENAVLNQWMAEAGHGVWSDELPCEATMIMNWRVEKHRPSTATSQYARSGLHMPRRRKHITAVTRTLAAISTYMKILFRVSFLMRSRNRQMEIFVNMMVMKVCIQSSHPIIMNRRI